MPALQKKQSMTKLPNAKEDQIAYKYAQADAEYKAAEALRKNARAEFDMIFKDELANAGMGLSQIHDSKFSTVILEKKNGGSSLDRTLLFNALAEFDFKAEEINKIIEKASKPRAGQTIIRCIVKGE